MQRNNAYNEVIEFIASASPQKLIDFRPSEQSKARVADLIFREKTGDLSAGVKSKLDHTMMMEELMSLAKARAYRLLTKRRFRARTDVPILRSTSND